MPERLLTVAYCVVPKIGGTFRHYVRLRKALLPFGVKVLAVSAGSSEAQFWDDGFADEGCVLVAPEASDPKTAAMALSRWLEDNAIDVIIPMSSAIATSSLPHLPHKIRVVMRCSSITRHAYDIVTCHDASAVIVASPRQYEDLRCKRGIAHSKLFLIPHGIDAEEYRSFRKASSSGVLRLGYVGRLEHQDKGCLYLADLCAELERRGLPYLLHVVGDGPDRTTLQARISRVVPNGRVHWHGALNHIAVKHELWDMIDVFLLPSHFEGFPNSLLEAMAARCVPVASHIRGVTDWIIEHGKTGFLFPRGDTGAMANYVEHLFRERRALNDMAEAAARAVKERFSLTAMGEGYYRVLQRVIADSPPGLRPRPWSEFRINRAFRPTWRRFVPTSVKIFARRLGLIT